MRLWGKVSGGHSIDVVSSLGGVRLWGKVSGGHSIDVVSSLGGVKHYHGRDYTEIEQGYVVLDWNISTAAIILYVQVHHAQNI